MLVHAVHDEAVIERPVGAMSDRRRLEFIGAVRLPHVARPLRMKRMHALRVVLLGERALPHLLGGVDVAFDDVFRAGDGPGVLRPRLDELHGIALQGAGDAELVAAPRQDHVREARARHHRAGRRDPDVDREGNRPFAGPVRRDLVLELLGIVHVQEPRDAVAAREDVVADTRVRVPLHLVEQQGGASVEVLLDRRDFEVRIDLHVRGDQLADGLEVLERRAKAPDVLLHPTPPRGDTAPGPRAPSRPRRRGPRPRRAGPGAAASSTISARGPAGSTYSRATAIGSVKRRGPALPGLSSRRCSRRSMLGRCEWPEIRTSTPWLAGSPRSVLRSWMTQSRTPPTSVVAISGMDAAQAPRSLLPRTTMTGTILPSSSRIAAEPTSPACTITSTPASAVTASGRRSPCVSEMTPTTALEAASRGRARTRRITAECSRCSLRLP